MNHNRQIVCISSHYWDDPWFRKQQFMHRFHNNGYKVAYVEPSFSIIRKVESSKKEYATNRILTSTIKEIKKNLFIIKLPRYTPYWTRPLVSRFNFLYLSYQIQSALKKIGFRHYILWVYVPQFIHGIKILKYMKLIVDIIDDLAAYNYDNESKYIYIKNCMEHLAIKSDLTIVTASTLFEKFRNISTNIHIVPNGYDSNLFTGKNNFFLPLDIKDIPKPIIGFVGTIFSFLDFNLLNYIIKYNPDKSFVFIGNYESNIKKKWLYITDNYRNVFWLGKKKKEDIPNYINNFDVCINPFRVDDVSKSVSPLKVFEYLAMKKPVISAKMESLAKEEVASFIYFASSYEDFNKKLNIALKGKDDFAINLNYEKVKIYSWDNLFIKVKQLIEKI